MKIVIMDAQGGGIGKMLIEQIRKASPERRLTAVGTNAAATAAMIKAGAAWGATGENAVKVNAADADLILAPIGMLLCDSMLGEVTGEMATAIGRSRAFKIMVPMSRCGLKVAGTPDMTIAQSVESAVKTALSWLEEH